MKEKENKKEEKEPIEVHLTMKLPLKVGPLESDLLTEVRRQYTRSFNNNCKVAWAKKVRSSTALHRETYYPEKKKCDLPSQAMLSARMKAFEAVAGVRVRLRKGKKASCPHSRGVGVRYDKRNYTLRLEEKIVGITTLRGRGRTKFSFEVPDYYEDLYNDLVEGEKAGTLKEKEKHFATTTLEVLKRGNNFFLHLSIKKTVKIPKLDKDTDYKVVGIDLGVNRPVVMSTNEFLGEGSIRDLENKHSSTNKELQAKGTKSAKRKLKKRSGRRQRFRRDIDHNLANAILESVEKGDVLVLEDLTDIRDRVRANKTEHRRRLHSWSFAQLKTVLLYKAALKGVHVRFIDPAYTSQECSHCGHTERGNRKGPRFRCKECGFQLDADLNASRNIRCRGLEVLFLEGVASERMQRDLEAKGLLVGPGSTGHHVSPSALGGSKGRNKPRPSGRGS